MATAELPDTTKPITTSIDKLCAACSVDLGDDMPPGVDLPDEIAEPIQSALEKAAAQIQSQGGDFLRAANCVASSNDSAIKVNDRLIGSEQIAGCALRRAIGRCASLVEG